MTQKPGRNDPCPCGSGKKYKQCCLSKERPSPTGGRKFKATVLKATPKTQTEEAAPSALGPDLIERTFAPIIPKKNQETTSS